MDEHAVCHLRDTWLTARKNAADDDLAEDRYREPGSGWLLFGTLLLLGITFVAAFLAWVWKGEKFALHSEPEPHPLEGVTTPRVGLEEGQRIGGALFFALTFGELAWWWLPNAGAIEPIAAVLVAIAAATWWLLPRRHTWRGQNASIAPWPVRFVVPELAPRHSAVTHRSTALPARGQGTTHSCLAWAVEWAPAIVPSTAGMRTTVSRLDAPTRKRAYGIALDWNRITAIAIDRAAQVIDLAGADSPGLRLSCTPDNVDEVRTFVRKRVDCRFLELLSPS